jgi:hypothetical protein
MLPRHFRGHSMNSEAKLKGTPRFSREKGFSSPSVQRYSFLKKIDPRRTKNGFKKRK